MTITRVPSPPTRLLPISDDDYLQNESSRRVQQACESCMKGSCGVVVCATGLAMPVAACALPNSPVILKIAMTLLGLAAIDIGLDCIHSASEDCPCGNRGLTLPTRPSGIE